MSRLPWWLRWVAADMRFRVYLYWLMATGRGRRNAPQRLEDFYNAQVRIWNHHQNERL